MKVLVSCDHHLRARGTVSSSGDPSIVDDRSAASVTTEVQHAGLPVPVVGRRLVTAHDLRRIVVFTIGRVRTTAVVHIDERRVASIILFRKCTDDQSNGHHENNFQHFSSFFFKQVNFLLLLFLNYGRCFSRYLYTHLFLFMPMLMTTVTRQVFLIVFYF